MMNRVASALCIGLLATALPARAGSVLIKLGTVAPKDSRYVQLLEQMGTDWTEASGGLVKLRIYPGGVAGNEGDMVRKIGVGQLQGAALTTVGMHDITSEPQTLQVPFLIHDQKELEYVLQKLRPRLDATLAKKGFVAVNWADVGEVKFFSTFSLRSTASVPQSKVWLWEGDPAAADGWRAAGFQPIVLASADILPSLQTGMINTVTMPPVYAFAARVFEKANHMLDLNWAALTGATVVKKETWDKIPADIQPKLLAIADGYAGKLTSTIKQLNDDAVTQMKAQGLIIDQPESVAAWEALAKKAWVVARGRAVPADVFDEIQRLVKEYRSQPH
jgi:TRAP-type C4-dicarboxylate transport system substrate-binding protein